MSFLSKLNQFGDAFLSSINEQFAGENTVRSLDTVDPNDPDRVQSYGMLGDFAERVDKTAQRSYLESGYIRNIKPRSYEILMQEPDMTIVIKKRLFSSLIDNYNLDLMDAGDKLFFKASKRLFQNKCAAISTYERLTKIEKIVVNKGVLDEYMVPQILSGIDALDALGVDILDEKTRATTETLRKLSILSEPNQFTTWIVDKDSPFASDTGEGVGTFELTTVASVSTTVSTTFGGGSANLTIEDPYNLMTVTNHDIDKAITDATNFFKQNNFFRVTEAELERVTNDLRQELNTLRMRRNVQPIQFITSPDSIIYKKVRAINEGDGKEIIFNYDPGFLGIGGDVTLDENAYDGPNGLSRKKPSEESGTVSIGSLVTGALGLGSGSGSFTKSEDQLFKTIIKNTFQLLSLKQNTRSEIAKFNDESTEHGRNIQYVREKMRLHYGGKTIIQPMDVVTIFVGSKTILDNKISGIFEKNFTSKGMGGGQILKSIDNTIKNIEQSINNMDSFFGGGSKNSSIEMEKLAVVGADFPTWLWNLLKNDFTKQSAGVCVFNGPVTGAKSNYTAENGKYVVSISIKDNSHYFEISQINISPSVEVFNSTLYDPLTPFDLDHDASSGFLRGEVPKLLEENEKLLRSPNVKSKNGRHRGFPASKFLYKIDDGESTKGFNFRSVKNDPDGFVYRWKSGIGSLTAFGAPHPITSIKEERAPSLTKDPFAGQDSMNVLSLLITGQPYNFNTFMKAGVESGNLTHEDSSTFLRGLVSDLSKQNKIWGGFIPFKKLIISEQGYKFLASGQFDITKTNQRINDLVARRAAFFDALVQSADGIPFANNPRLLNIDESGFSAQNTAELKSTQGQDAAVEIAKLDLQIAQHQDELRRLVSNSNLGEGELRIYGDDISFDPTISDNSSNITEADAQNERIEFRKKLYTLTQRRLWKVKANDDPNLFVVDDQYDKNYDILAFERSLAGNFELLKSSYTDVKGRIDIVKNVLGLEVFADTQGHIQARPPGYNKVPSSVFYRMLKDKERDGIRVFPKLLESLFINQIEGLVDQIEITEDNIRLRAAALGKGTDESAKKLINGSPIVPNTQTGFAFVTNSNGRFGTKDIRNLIKQASPEDVEDGRLKSLTEFNTSISDQLNRGSLFDAVTRISVLNQKDVFQPISNTANSRIAEITNRLERFKNTSAIDVQAVFSSNRSTGTKQADILKIVNDISRLVSERQSLLKMLSAALKNAESGAVLDNDPQIGKKIMFPSLNKKTTIPPIVEHMIEDEEFDDLGPGSGARYIIKENQIISMEITEQPPAHTIAEVTGLLGEGFVKPPGGLDLGGGNAIVTAYAADYDMWRMYGFRRPQSVQTPFFTNPDTQCAPYAVYLLNLARKNILQANVVLVGNEFMQPGEVVYIESKDLLFYVESVAHSFSFGDFKTTLKLTYGHNPGEYIPTMLDIVGKGLYSKRHQANLIRNNRHGHASGEMPLNVIVADPPVQELFSSDNLTTLMKGSFSQQNRKNMSNIILALSGIYTPNSGKQPALELRVYKNETQGYFINESLKKIAEGIKEWIKNPSRISSEKEGSLLPDTSILDNIRLDDDLIEVVEVDAADPQSPSSSAWAAARSLVESGGGSQEPVAPGVTTEDIKLFNNIIDVWVVFKNVSETTNTSRNKLDVNSEKQQELLRELEDATRAAFTVANPEED